MANGLGASLAKTNRVLAIDMRGHGQTVGPDGKRQQRTPNMDLDVLAFMDALKIQQAHIGGFSMGGSITASSWRGRRNGSSPRTSADRACARNRRANSRRLIPPDPKGTAPLDAEARKLYQARQTAEAARGRREQRCRRSVAALVAAGAGGRAAAGARSRRRSTFPILAVVGEFDQPYTRTHRLWREAPNFQRVILKNRGHLSSYMAGLCPEVYRDALTRFIVGHNPGK